MRNKWDDNTYANEFHFGANGNPAFRDFMGINLGDQPDFDKKSFGRNENRQMRLAIEYTIGAMRYLGANGKFGEDKIWWWNRLARCGYKY
ncbi:hypothetical protein FHW36_11429 [Chitinophaga polysaccharea]|uniref:Uncharacterized protein n=1 Tax=Chitinophaga polysaccharea TaxID=1293035 RepID=A0A561P3F4_9BACT|nr:hypothetical protein FHW36_11429 [Chitinophaga polysaccharea]